MTKLYIDTNVIIDAVEGRKNLLGNDIGDYAMKLFCEAVSCKYDIIFSSFTAYELNKISSTNLTIFLSWIKKKIIKVLHDEKDEERARQLDNSNFDDALHVVLAEKASADFIVTRNIKDFKAITTRIQIKRPEELI